MASSRQRGPTDPAIAILAGGRSLRFGSDKAAAHLAGRSLLALTLDHARAVSGRVLVVGRGQLPADADARGVELLPDREPGLGPVGGLHSACARVDDALVLLACDQPAVDASVLRWLIDTWRAGPSEDGVVPIVDGRPQPCAAIYPRRTRALCAHLLAAGRGSLHAVLDAADLRPVVPPAAWHWRFASANTPTELARLAERMTTDPAR